jgi:hypothetical protein
MIAGLDILEADDLTGKGDLMFTAIALGQYDNEGRVWVLLGLFCGEFWKPRSGPSEPDAL